MDRLLNPRSLCVGFHLLPIYLTFPGKHGDRRSVLALGRVNRGKARRLIAVEDSLVSTL